MPDCVSIQTSSGFLAQCPVVYIYSTGHWDVALSAYLFYQNVRVGDDSGRDIINDGTKIKINHEQTPPKTSKDEQTEEQTLLKL